jgi:hypothetical protein
VKGFSGWIQSIKAGRSVYFFKYTDHRSKSSFPIWTPFIYFSCLIALARNSSTTLNENEDIGHPCLIPDFGGNEFRFSLFSTMLTLVLSSIAFIMQSYIPYIPIFFRTFIIKDVEFCQKTFLHWLMCFLSLILFMCCITLLIYTCSTIFANMEWNQLDHVYDLFHVLLNLVWKYFIENFCIYIH